MPNHELMSPLTRRNQQFHFAATLVFCLDTLQGVTVTSKPTPLLLWLSYGPPHYPNVCTRKCRNKCRNFNEYVNKCLNVEKKNVEMCVCV